jgi:hypothetical protein
VLESILADVTEFDDDSLYHTLNLCRTLAFVRENTVMVARCEEGSGHV